MRRPQHGEWCPKGSVVPPPCEGTKPAVPQQHKRLRVSRAAAGKEYKEPRGPPLQPRARGLGRGGGGMSSCSAPAEGDYPQPQGPKPDIVLCARCQMRVSRPMGPVLPSEGPREGGMHANPKVCR